MNSADSGPVSGPAASSRCAPQMLPPTLDASTGASAHRRISASHTRTDLSLASSETLPNIAGSNESKPGSVPLDRRDRLTEGRRGP